MDIYRLRVKWKEWEGPWRERSSIDRAPGKKHQVMGLDEQCFGDTLGFGDTLRDPLCLLSISGCLELPSPDPLPANKFQVDFIN